MAISSYFDEEFTKVGGYHLSFSSGAAEHEQFQFSYAWNGSGYTIQGGTDLACEHGAADLLEELGFRYYTPDTNWWKYPVSIDQTKTANKKEFTTPLATLSPIPLPTWTLRYAGDRTALVTATQKQLILNGVNKTLSTGHRWGSIISSSTLTSFWAANPSLLLNLGPGAGNSITFNLEAFTRGDSNWTLLTQICAQWLLRDSGWYEDHHDFDAVDGDTNTSEKVFTFASDVAVLCRAGVPAVGPYSEITSLDALVRPDAKLGLYSYANHKRAPTSVCPHIHVAVATAYNDTGLTLTQLIAEFIPKVDFVGIREYFDVFDWGDGKPLSNFKCSTTGLDVYEDYYAQGFYFINGQNTSNWFYNVLMNRRLVKTLRTGVLYSYQDALDDIMADIFAEDNAVRDLYTLWGSPAQKHHKWSLREAFDYIDAMQDGWYKTKFKKLGVILYEQITMPTPTGDPGDTFPTQWSLLLSHVLALRSEFIIDSYEWVNDLGGNAGVQKALYPNLTIPFFQHNTPLPVHYTSSSSAHSGTELAEPDWYANPVMPTVEEFDTYYTALQAGTQRDEEQDSQDLVIVHGITPAIAGQGTATGFGADIRGMSFMVVGPADLTITYDPITIIVDGEPQQVTRDPEPRSYPAGKTYVQELVPCKIDCANQLVFMDYSQWTKREDRDQGAYHYVYVPTRLDGEVIISTEGRIRVRDAEQQLDVFNEYADNYVDPASLGPGQLLVHAASTSLYGAVYNANKWLSLYPDIILVPRTFAEEDIPNISFVTKP